MAPSHGTVTTSDLGNYFRLLTWVATNLLCAAITASFCARKKMVARLLQTAPRQRNGRLSPAPQSSARITSLQLRRVGNTQNSSLAWINLSLRVLLPRQRNWQQQLPRCQPA